MLLRGGLRELEVLLAEIDAVGEGEFDILIPTSSWEMSSDDMFLNCLPITSLPNLRSLSSTE